MLSVSDAQEHILSVFRPVGTLTLPLDLSAGCVLAQDISAEIDFPPFENSNMDGFALRAADVTQASPTAPVTLTVVADIPAGCFSDITIQPGQAARIMTGAPLPPDADAVVMVEDTDFNDRLPGTPAPEEVKVFRAVSPGSSIRHRGEDLHTGDKVLSTGQRLRAQDIGLLAMLGVVSVPVYRLPRMALLSSGNELLPVEAPFTPGKIHDVNSYTLAALARRCGAEIINLGVSADLEADVRSRLERAAAEKVDLIVTSAGVSVGALDFVKAVLEHDGSLDFWKVNMRPGKPLAFGQYLGIPFFGLPGNPVSAFIGFEVFVAPALKKLSGMTPRPRLRQKARLVEPVESDGRESYLRAVVQEENGQRVVRLTGHQGSGNLLSLVQANALLIVPSGVKSLPANSEVELWPIE